MKRFFAVGIALVTSLGGLGIGFAQTDAVTESGAPELQGEQYRQFLDAADELRCPTCAGLSVLESDAAFSNQIKDIVREKVKEGASKDQIMEYFTERYGPWILRAPPTEGFHILAWLIPFSMLGLGPPLLWFFVWRRKKIPETAGVRATEEIEAEMKERLESLRHQQGGVA